MMESCNHNHNTEINCKICNILFPIHYIKLIFLISRNAGGRSKNTGCTKEFRGAIGGKTGKTAVLPGFYKIERRGVLEGSVFVSNLVHCRECISTGAVGAQTRRSLGHHLFHLQILRLLVLLKPPDFEAQSSLL